MFRFEDKGIDLSFESLGFRETTAPNLLRALEFDIEDLGVKGLGSGESC